MKTGVKVFDAMTPRPVWIKPEVSIEQCSKLMVKKHVGGILVKVKDKLVGIITEKDIVRRVVAKGKNPKKLKVNDVMIKKIVTIEPEKDIYDAILVLKEHGFRHLPVVKNNKLLGILTMKDILKIEPTLYEILVEKSEIRGSAEKAVKGPEYVEGECESCGNYGQLYKVDDQVLCEECRDREKEK